MIEQRTKYIQSRLNIETQQIKNTLALLDADCTVPFIARYRKEQTGNLDEVQIGDIVKYADQFATLEKRRASILKALTEDDVLTDALKEKIEAADELTVLEDLYLPYKKKRKTKAETARKNGLEPLAKIIMSQKANDIESVAYRYLSDAVETVEKALEGARHIIAEWVNERSDIRNQIRYQLERFATIGTTVVKTKMEDEKSQKFRDYFDWSENLSRIPSHQITGNIKGY